MNWQRLSRRGLYACVFALSAVLLLAQGIELGHSHDDLQSQVDCQICLKHSGKGKTLLASGLSFDLAGSQVYRLDLQLHRPFLALPAAKSRAPPRKS